jgi:hypothetical protein
MAAPPVAARAPRIKVLAFSITYVLCVGFDLLFPGQAMH